MASDLIEPCDVINVHALCADNQAPGASALVKHDNFQVLSLRVTPEKAIPEHAVNGPIIVQCLDGDVDFSVDGNAKHMKPGDWMHVPGGAPHGVTAHADSRLLVIRLLT